MGIDVTSWQASYNPVSSLIFAEGTGSTIILKHSESFLVKVAYWSGGFTIGTRSPKPIVDKDMNANGKSKLYHKGIKGL